MRNESLPSPSPRPNSLEVMQPSDRPIRMRRTAYFKIQDSVFRFIDEELSVIAEALWLCKHIFTKPSAHDVHAESRPTPNY